MGKHAVQEHLGVETALVSFVESFPFRKVLPLTGDGAIASTVSVADDKERIVVKGVGNDVLVEVVAEIAVEPL